jgi:uncharacterized membrane protein
MKKNNKIYKIILTFFVFGFVIWLGGILIRTTIAYDLFVPDGSMELKPEYSNAVRIHAAYLYSATALLTGISYGIAAISSIFLAYFSRKEFKQRGWLFMAFCIFILTIPIQSYFIYLDFQLANAVYYEKIDDFFHPKIQKYFVDRIKDVKNSSFYAISLLAALTCILYSIWRPLEKKISNKNSDNLEEKAEEKSANN